MQELGFHVTTHMSLSIFFFFLFLLQVEVWRLERDTSQIKGCSDICAPNPTLATGLRYPKVE